MIQAAFPGPLSEPLQRKSGRGQRSRARLPGAHLPPSAERTSHAPTPGLRALLGSADPRAADRDARTRSPPGGPGASGHLAAGWPLGLGAVRPVRPGDSGLTGDPAALPGAPAVGGTPGSVPAEQRAQQPRPAVLRWAQPARAGAGREEGADTLQEVGGVEGHGGGQGKPGQGAWHPS